MALTTRVRNGFDNEMIYVVIRMDEKTHANLKRFMHCTDKLAIRVPHGVKIMPRGRGWYRMEASNEFRGVEKIMFAMKAIKAFERDEEKKVDEELKRMAPIMRNPGLKIVSFSNAHSEGEYGYMGIVENKPASPPSPSKLNALVAKFSRPQHKAH